MTAALEGGEWSAERPGRTLTQGKVWYPFYRRLGGPQGRSGRAEYIYNYNMLFIYVFIYIIIYIIYLYIVSLG